VPGGTDEQVTDDYERWVAEQVARQHDEQGNADRASGSCARCSPEGCTLERWARAYLAGATVPYPIDAL
jgi:hypothetical protein